MAGARLPEEDGEGGGLFAEINITPLTDIFLVLLIIFMVTSSVMADAGARAGVNVNLPKGAAHDIAPSGSDVTVAVTTDGKLIVDGKPIEPDQLKALFERVHAKDPDAQVVVQADEAAHHGRVVGVMELAKGAGLRRLAIATRRGR
jgi:biopolymer transport protein ExbD